MNMEKLSQVASLSKTAQIIINDLSERQRYRHRSDLRKMFSALEESHKGVNKEEFMEVFKKLQELGIGSIVHGRGTTPTRFIWNYNLRDVGLVAKGKMKPAEMQELRDGKPVASMASPAPQYRPSTVGTGEQVTMLLIAPSGGVETFKVSGERLPLFRQLLKEFAE